MNDAQLLTNIRMRNILGLDELNELEIGEIQRIVDWIRTPTIKGDFILRKNQDGKFVEVEQRHFRRLAAFERRNRAN